MNGPGVFALLVAFTVLLAFTAVWRFVAYRDPVVHRLDGYGAKGAAQHGGANAQSGHSLSPVGRLIYGFGMGPKLADALSRANVSMTVAEYVMIMLVLAGIGLVIGVWRVNLAFGVLLAGIAAALPVLYLRIAYGRRQRAFNSQLPDILTLLVGALRAGYGLNQSLDVIVDEMPDPAAGEFRRVLRANALGVSLQQALLEMSERVQSEDLTLVITAIIIQHETGGNLAQILDTIGETIRDRVRILREVQVMTSQQRFTGYLLAGLPIFLALVINFVSPSYYDPFFEPGTARLMPFIGAAMILVGFVIMRRIVDIDV